MTAVRIAGFAMMWVGLAAAGTIPGASPYLTCLAPLLAFAFMGTFFRRTLRAGAEPLITRIARKSDPDMPADVQRYTRALTSLWTAAFVMLFVATAALMYTLPAAPATAWAHALGIVLPLALFMGERVYRRRRFPHRAQGTIGEQVRNTFAVIREMASDGS